jgi:Na+-driven multidrug efflux pump
MSITRRIAMFCMLGLVTLTSYAQGAPQEAKMADMMRSNGRIYVVVAVVLTILLGLILYVFRLDRKIAKLEKENR